MIIENKNKIKYAIICLLLKEILNPLEDRAMISSISTPPFSNLLALVADAKSLVKNCEKEL